MQRTTKQTLPKATKPQPKQSAPIRKPATQKPAIKSTYSASYGRPSSAKYLMRPTSSRGSAKMYIDSVLNKDTKNGTDSKALSRKQGNVFIILGRGLKVSVGREMTYPWRGINLLLVELYFLNFLIKDPSALLSILSIIRMVVSLLVCIVPNGSFDGCLA